MNYESSVEYQLQMLSAVSSGLQGWGGEEGGGHVCFKLVFPLVSGHCDFVEG